MNLHLLQLVIFIASEEEDFGRYPKCNEHGSKSTRSCEQLSELDRPVDVLFFGDVSPYRFARTAVENKAE